MDRQRQTDRDSKKTCQAYQWQRHVISSVTHFNWARYDKNYAHYTQECLPKISEFWIISFQMFTFAILKTGTDRFFFSHIRTVQRLDIIKVLFIHQLMHQWVVLKNNIKIYIKTAPTCFGVTVTPSSVTVVKTVKTVDYFNNCYFSKH
jgi:hypothetical protein